MSVRSSVAPEAQQLVVEAAVKLAQRGFDSKASAVAALRRKLPSVGGDAGALLDQAGVIYARALAIVGVVRTELLAIYAREKTVVPQDIDRLIPKLEREFPDWSSASLKVALWSATVFHLR